MAASFFLVALSILDISSAIQLPISLPSSYAPEKFAGRPLVSSSAIQADIKSDNLLKRANDLYDIAKLSMDEYNHPTRVIGSEGHLGTVDYIYSTISSLGDYYTLSNQSLTGIVGQVYESRLVLGHDVPQSARPMSLTPPTKNKQPVSGPLVLVSNNGCDASDYPTMKGAIALIKRGVCSFAAKSAFAGQAGAVAAVVYNNEKGKLSGTLGSPSSDYIATFGLSDDDAKPYIDQLQNGNTVDAVAYIDSMVAEVVTTNIIAQTKDGDPDNCVMLGGHSDSVEEGPGINDDGSGSISLLEVATQLSKYSVKNCVRFAWWAGEEEGLLGSNYYVSKLSDSENIKIRLFMDYDMMASPNFAYQVYNATNAVNPVGSEELRDMYISFYNNHGLNHTLIAFNGRSDYDAFIKNGIPGGGIATGADETKTPEEVEMFGGKAGIRMDPCYHQLCDDVGNLNMTAFEINTKLIAHSVATYAVSLEGFPKRTGVSGVSAQGPEKKYSGRWLVM